jgi:MFS transporter, DHA2 family, methylenomycin A resistance protein
VSSHAAVREHGLRPGVGRPGLGLIGLCLGTALIVMEANVMNVAVPTIRARLHTNAALGLWVVDAYTLVLAALLLSAGRLGDRIGPRRGYLLGLGVFSLASVGAGLSPNATWLVIARALQGVGAALLAPAPLTLITRIYLDPAQRARAVATWVSVGGIGFVVGPLVSGLLIDTLGWRSIFIINLPLAALTACLVVGHVAELERQRVSFDFRGQLLAVIGLVALVWGLVQSSLDGWDSPAVISSVIAGALVFAYFLHLQQVWSRRGVHVLLPASILGSRPVRAGLAGGGVYNFALYGMLIVYTFDFQDLRHYSAAQTGLAFLPLTVAATVATQFLGGRFVAARGPRAGLATGMGVSALALSVLIWGADSLPYPVLAAAFVIFATGMALSAPSQTLAVMAHAPDQHKNMASSALNTSRQTGGVVGVALLGALASAHPITGTRIAMAAAALACLTVATSAVRNLPGPPADDHQREQGHGSAQPVDESGGADEAFVPVGNACAHE